MKKIPFNRPFIIGKELYYISQAVWSGHIAGDGFFTKKCNDWMEQKFNAKKILLTNSCTAALEISAILCNFEFGDEVIMPSFTFASTANAFALRGAQIKFIDIRRDTLNIDENLIESAITEKTKAVVPVHYAGVGCEMDTVLKIAKKYDLTIVEDAAQGVNATYKNRYLGAIGQLGAYSFHETKNFISGEGGALVINDERFIDRAEIIREKGTDRSKFFRGEVDKYTWVDIGSSYGPSEIISAFLYAQLQESDVINKKRWQIFRYYEQGLHALHEEGLIRLPSIPPECSHNGHLFYILVNGKFEERDNLLSYLNKNGVNAVFHFVPLHTSPMGRNMGYKSGCLPNTEELSQRLIRLPCYFELKEEEQEYIIEKIYNYFKFPRRY
jgi:dTDP-4-amino-4,6-dideoxygalactose transaminase